MMFLTTLFIVLKAGKVSITRKMDKHTSRPYCGKLFSDKKKNRPLAITQMNLKKKNAE